MKDWNGSFRYGRDEQHWLRRRTGCHVDAQRGGARCDTESWLNGFRGAMNHSVIGGGRPYGPDIQLAKG